MYTPRESRGYVNDVDVLRRHLERLEHRQEKPQPNGPTGIIGLSLPVRGSARSLFRKADLARLRRRHGPRPTDRPGGAAISAVHIRFGWRKKQRETRSNWRELDNWVSVLVCARVRSVVHVVLAVVKFFRVCEEFEERRFHLFSSNSYLMLDVIKEF